MANPGKLTRLDEPPELARYAYDGTVSLSTGKTRWTYNPYRERHACRVAAARGQTFETRRGFVSMSPLPNGDKQALIRAIEERVVRGPGMASPELRAKAFENGDLPEPLAALLHKVAERSFQVTDGDFAAGVAAGFTEDQLFELVICAAIGESSRLYQAGMAALAEASG